MQIGEDNPFVVRSGEQIKRLRGESGAANVRGVRTKGLHETTPTGSDIPEHAGPIFLTHRQQLSGGVHAHRRSGASCVRRGNGGKGIGRKEGRKEERKRGRKKGREEGRKEERKEARKECRKEGRDIGRKEGRKEDIRGGTGG